MTLVGSRLQRIEPGLRLLEKQLPLAALHPLRHHTPSPMGAVVVVADGFHKQGRITLMEGHLKRGRSVLPDVVVCGFDMSGERAYGVSWAILSP